MAACVLSASFAVFLVRERECQSKALQMVAGAPASAFWAATYAWDLLSFSVPALGAPAASHGAGCRSLRSYTGLFLCCGGFWTRAGLSTCAALSLAQMYLTLHLCSIT